jgi:hypothetical protein
MKVSLADAIKMPSNNKLKAARRMKAFEEYEKENTKPTRKEKKSAVMDDQVKSAVTRPRPLPSIVVADLNHESEGEADCDAAGMHQSSLSRISGLARIQGPH